MVSFCAFESSGEGQGALTTKKFIGTLLISVHAFAGVFIMYMVTRPLLSFPGGRQKEIEGLKQIRNLLNGCSDELT